MNKGTKAILIILGSVFIFTNSALAYSLVEDFNGASINIADLTTTSGLDQWNDLVRWQINPTGGNTGGSPDAWAEHTPRDDGGAENSLLFFGFDATGYGAGSTFTLDFDFLNSSSSFKGYVHVGGLVGSEKISRFAPWQDLEATTFSKTQISNGVNSWASMSTISGVVDADYEVLYIAFNLGGTAGPRGIDNVNLTVNAPVPEPTAMLLFGTGLAGLAAVARRKRS